ncbi:MAG TPA: hypothetical protein VEV17_01035 [Bryobacteraceae bacterium]|nr:hypothetical protein [Bryobacteraceae bacterium]
MLQALTTVSLPQVYCRSCHLSTRSDMLRCLHCNKLLSEPRIERKRVGVRLKSRRRSR